MESKSSRIMRPLALLAVVSLIILAAAARGQAGPAAAGSHKVYTPVITYPKPLQIELVPLITGIPSETVTDIAHAGDGRLFIVLREGIVRVIRPDGTLDPKPFMDISKDVTYNLNWEQGLLGMAFHPQFPTVPHVYVVYTDISSIRVARASLSKTDPTVIDRFSLISMMRIGKPPLADGSASPVHNAGDLTFGPDGMLYIPIGDGGPDPYQPEGVPGDPYNNSQRRDELLGGILRVNVDENAGLKPDCGKEKYSIPTDNPFLGNADCDEIWATGLRNPWRMSFDRLTGDLWIGDVGEWQYEEVNYVPAGTGRGANYGWHCWEGTYNYAASIPEFAGQCGPQQNYVPPLAEYRHDDGDCSITGGFVYRGSKYPALYGRYVYADFCTGHIWTLWRDNSGRWNKELNAAYPIGLSTFGEGADGELYVGVWEDFYAPGDPTVEVYKVTVKR